MNYDTVRRYALAVVFLTTLTLLAGVWIKTVNLLTR